MSQQEWQQHKFQATKLEIQAKNGILSFSTSNIKLIQEMSEKTKLIVQNRTLTPSCLPPIGQLGRGEGARVISSCINNSV
jgi:hypothetical protein